MGTPEAPSLPLKPKEVRNRWHLLLVAATIEAPRQLPCFRIRDTVVVQHDLGASARSGGDQDSVSRTQLRRKNGACLFQPPVLHSLCSSVGDPCAVTICRALLGVPGALLCWLAIVIWCAA